MTVDDWLKINMHRQRCLDWGKLITSDWHQTREAIFPEHLCLMGETFMTGAGWIALREQAAWYVALGTKRGLA